MTIKKFFESVITFVLTWVIWVAYSHRKDAVKYAEDEHVSMIEVWIVITPKDF